MKGYILDVERANKTVLEVHVKIDKEISSFIRENKKIIRFPGRSVSKKAYEQVRAIFSKSENIILPKKEKTSEEKKKLREINRGKLTPHEKQRLITLQKSGIKYCTLGWLQIDRWQETDKGLVKNPMKIIDLPSAIRQQDHILKKYLGNDAPNIGETKQIMKFHEIISGLHQYLVHWKKSGKTKRREIEIKIVKIASQLEYCSNLYKVDTRDLLYDISTLEDTLSRINPPAMAANIIPILGLLAKRLEQIQATIPTIALRKELLKFERDVAEAEKNNALIKIKALLSKSNISILNDKDFSQIRIRQIIYSLYRLHASPYYDARHYSINMMAKISLLLNTRQMPQVRHYLKIVRHVLSNEI